MPNTSISNEIPYFMQGGGEMGQLIRNTNWNETALGDPMQWHVALKSAVSITLNSVLPMSVLWGPEYTLIYNNGLKQILASGNYPKTLGYSAYDAFPNFWPQIESMVQQANQGKPIAIQNFKTFSVINGSVTDRYFDFSFTPLYVDNGHIGGILITLFETTEKYIAETKLQQSNAELEFTINAAELATWNLDTATNTFTGSKRLAEWFDLPDTNHTNLELAVQKLLPTDQKRVAEAISRALDPASGGDYEVDYCIQTNDTDERFIRAKGKAFFKDNGEPLRLVGVSIDITRDVLAKQAIARSEENLLNLVRNAPVAMTVFKGSEHVISLINQRTLDMWQTSLEHVMYRPLFEAFPHIKKQGLEDMLQKVYTTGQSVSVTAMPVTITRNNTAETRYYDFSYEALRDANNQIAGVITVGIDTTEAVVARQKIEEAEERVRVAVEAADIGTFDLTVDTHYIITSPRFDEIFGVRKSTNHDDYFNVIHTEDLVERERTLNVAFETGKLYQIYRVIKQDGRISWVQLQGKVYYDSEGKPKRILGTALDITEQKRLQQLKDDFISIASHELKTPLTSLNASLQLLTRKLSMGSTAAVSALLSQSNTSLKKLIKLASDLLNVTKIREGQVALNYTSFVISKLVYACCHNLINDDYTLQITGDMNVEVMADASKIEQVIVNFVSNAAKYAPQSPRIVVHITNEEQIVRVAVTDKGPGITPDKVPYLFDRYFQVESNGVQFSGLGLGLYISSEIIKRHGGEIGVSSQLGDGSTFWFTLPKID
ncbi:PAS domain-containing sensor histidine kinase [Mucilaginibacter lacusdianchii]|uniref:PAS domain-containing sensor histidine kinase n=1 Tax=Mucilaginibacter lacusdianchii TaxID=2684211 RepID=UPI00131AFD37|nr:ATP-binding protein [Mucilaginibacter sp. JXJ CY 39]